MGKYQTYPEYRDSEVNGLGTIPSHWEVMQLKRTVNGCVNGIWGSEPKKDGTDTIVLRVADFDRPKLSLQEDGYTYRKIEDKEKITRKLKRGDLLLEKSGGGEKTLVGQVVLFDKDFEAVTSNFVAKMTPNEGFNSRFLNYVFSRFYSDNINYCSIKQNTGIQNLDSAAYLAEKFGFPLEEEQEKIANFLDHETTRIGALIEKQQQLIKLLKEKRQAVISQVVTKGLDPETKMRESGIEWLGTVPEEWKIVPLKYLVIHKAGIQMGPFGGMLKDLEYSETGYKLYGQENTISGDFTKGGRWLTKERYKELSNYKLKGGDIVLTRKGSLGKARQVYKLETPGIIDSDTIRVRVDSLQLTSDFLSLLMHEAHYISEQIMRMRRGSILPGLNTETISNIKILLPLAKALQDELVVEVKRVIEFYDHALGKCLDKCELLSERRAALISAAVTGKIDVRNWQANTVECVV